MTEDHLPIDSNSSDRLPARQDPGIRQAIAHPQGARAIDLAAAHETREDEDVDLVAYWRVLVKHRLLIASVTAGVIALALLLTLMTQPQYRAGVLMQIEKEPPPILQTEGAMPFYYDTWDPEFLKTQYELLQSRSLAERVATQLAITQSTLDALKDEGWLSRLKALVSPASKAPKAGSVAGSPQESAVPLAEATGVVQGGLTVAPITDSRLVELYFDSPDPRFSVKAVNTFAEVFIATGIDRRMGASSYAKTYLEDQLKQTKVKLEESERKLVEYAQSEGLINTGDQGQSLATQNLTALNAALATAQGERIRAQARWGQASSGGSLPADMLMSSGVGTLRQQRADLQGQYQQKLAIFKPDYPEMQQLKRQLDEIDKQIAAELGRVRDSVKAEYAAAAAQENMIKAQVAALRTQALDVDGRSIQYNILKREVDTNRQLYDNLLQRFKEVGAASDVRTNNISIIDRAQQAHRFKPSLSRNLLLGLLAGLALGVLAAFALEFLDDSLKTADDVEQKLKLAVLGIIPKLGPRESVVSASTDPRSSFSEAYGSVRTALQFSTDHGAPRSLLVTSPSPGEGKSTTAVSLARNFAQLGKRVLLIEADLRNPSLNRVLGLKSEAGLSNLLAGGCTMAEVTLDADEPGLKVILAGPLPPNPAELLSGSKFISMLTVACERYDQVIVDGPPVLGLADSPVLANAVEGTLLVVTSGKTKIATAQAALKRLLSARGRVIGALLTKYDAKAAGYGYYYDSHYSYGRQPRLTRS